VEITTRPRSRRWQRLGTRLSLLTVALALGLLFPASLGLSPQAVTETAMGGSLSRGALAFERDVRHADELHVGDVISFPQPGSADGPRVIRRVVSVDGSSVVTRGDARPRVDPWVIQAGDVELSRTVFAVPVLGYPQLVVPWLTWAVVVLLVAMTALATTVVARRETARDSSTVVPTLDGSAVAAI